MRRRIGRKFDQSILKEKVVSKGQVEEVMMKYLPLL